MNSEIINNIYNNEDNLQFSNDRQRYIKYENLVPSIQYEMQGQEKQKNLKYFPIVTKETFTGQHTIYLAAEDNDSQNNNMTKYENNSIYKNKSNKINNRNKIILPQKNTELQIQNNKFEFLLSIPVKNEDEINKNKDKNKNKNQNNFDKINYFKEGKIEEEKKNYNYKNIKEDFISTTKNIYDTNKNINSILIHSYSVDNYSDILYKNLPNLILKY